MSLLDRIQSSLRTAAYSRKGYSVLALVLLTVEVLLCSAIIERVNYTEIDWIAYMQEVQGFLNGTLDYDRLEGQTGPCVYPAGFLYVYSLLYYLTSGGQCIRHGQYIFLGVYLLTLVMVFNIYRRVGKAPPYTLVFMCLLSYRIHSIYLLRLFNDPIAMFFLYASVNSLLKHRFSLASVLFSLAVSIKMNILLFAPGFLLVLLYYRGVLETIGHLCECAIVQLTLGAPFLFHNAPAYLSRSFNFGRQFLYVWTVNWRLLPEEVFLDRRFHVGLLACHVVCLSVLLFKFIRSRGGLMEFMRLYPAVRQKSINQDANSVVYPLFLSNFVGVVFSRSLHYQFYVWYFHSIVYLAWTVNAYSSPFRLLLIGLIEVCWNTYPSSVASSLLLHVCHLCLLVPQLLFPCSSSSAAGAEKAAVTPAAASRDKVKRA